MKDYGIYKKEKIIYDKNLQFMKCSKLLFKKDFFKKNYGNYILLILFISQFISSIIFCNKIFNNNIFIKSSIPNNIANKHINDIISSDSERNSNNENINFKNNRKEFKQ